METIYSYTYRNIDGSGILNKENFFSEDEYKIIARNEDYIAIDDHFFTSVEIRRIGIPILNCFLTDNAFGNAVLFNLYSDKKIPLADIKKMIQDGIADKVKYLGNVDLSVIYEELAV
ncbi:hypothetical protein [Psychrobacter sp. I-STPA6b]|uniref:hypothetical protein n=1 Tax=Psychrobacter sp. I-STPA6b TaxID=2585718 RepID=UPI001D0CB609|nr:hypothetical protein [Psychrobacter sp. I-STPA6b]